MREGEKKRREWERDGERDGKGETKGKKVSNETGP